VEDLKRLIREVPDFPKPGILFYDITTLLKDQEAFREAVNAMAEPYRAGPPDLIVAVDGREVKVFADLISYMVNYKRPGDTVTLTVLRAGQQLDLAVVLGERP